MSDIHYLNVECSHDHYKPPRMYVCNYKVSLHYDLFDVLRNCDRQSY